MEPTPPPAPEHPTPQPRAADPTVHQSSAAAKSAPFWRRFAKAKTLLYVLSFVSGIIITAALINQFVFQSYYVDGTSMVPTLHNNDRLIIDKVERTVALMQGKHYIPQRGQIVVLDSSLVDQAGRNEQLIKRVIGLPGDTVSIDKDGVVTITNQTFPQGFNANEKLGLTLEPAFVDSPTTVTLGDNQIFVMGDNRGPGGSFDSRSFGPVDSSKIEGRLFARIFPLNQTKVF